jgi:hypothetical protein
LISDEEMNFEDDLPKNLDDLIALGSATTRAIAEVIAGLESEPSNAVLQTRYSELHQRLSQIQEAFERESQLAVESLKAEFGVDDKWLEEFENAQRPVFEKDFWNSDIQRVPTTVKLEDVVANGYERLMPLVDKEWLREQANFRYRLSYDNSDSSDCRLHLVGRQRLLPLNAPARPQRLAQMLLLSEDLLKGRHDLDIFEAPMLVSEVAGLGASLAEISQLGPEATKKLQSLPTEIDREVISIVFELLVGAACVRHGHSIEMLPASNKKKTPDFRVHGLPVPMVVECKRRLGLNAYAEKEARHVERLYNAAQTLIDRYHPLVQVTFSQEVSEVPAEEFLAALTPLCESLEDDVEAESSWGTIRVRRLPNICEFSGTRVFSPYFLETVFDWNHVESDWDGLLCQISPTNAAWINKVSWPRGMKWKCNADASLLKKARGLTSLWAEAVQQIPAGEMGCVYIAYTEGMRSELADTRTKHLLDSVQTKALYHRASVRVPLTVINRLYPQALGNGGVELIESVIPMTLDGYDFMVGDWPGRVFTVTGSR